MAIRQADLLTAASNASINKSFSASNYNQATAFLSHSHHDRQLAIGLQAMLHDQGWNVYIDWQDASMPEIPNRTTAAQIQNQIRKNTWFLYLATANASNSKWCPWEIGFADGQKPNDKIVLITTEDAQGRHHGSEYLQLYHQITTTSNGGLALFSPGSTSGGRFVRQL